jgi:hypothetical protein
VRPRCVMMAAPRLPGLADLGRILDVVGAEARERYQGHISKYPGRSPSHATAEPPLSARVQLPHRSRLLPPLQARARCAAPCTC